MSCRNWLAAHFWPTLRPGSVARHKSNQGEGNCGNLRLRDLSQFHCSWWRNLFLRDETLFYFHANFGSDLVWLNFPRRRLAFAEADERRWFDFTNPDYIFASHDSDSRILIGFGWIEFWNRKTARDGNTHISHLPLPRRQSKIIGKKMFHILNNQSETVTLL